MITGNSGLPLNTQTNSGAHPTSNSIANGGFSGGKQPGRELNHLPFIAEIKNEWSHTSTPPNCLHGMGTEAFAFIFSPVFTFQ